METSSPSITTAAGGIINVFEAGADFVIDHSKSLTEELAQVGIKEVTHVASLTNTEEHYQEWRTFSVPLMR